MLAFIFKRLLELIPVLAVVALVVFSIVHLTPGDPARVMLGDLATEAEVARLREAMGLDQPIYVQFATWFLGLLRGDLGQSITFERPVLTAIIERAEPTITLTIFSLLIAVAVGITTGVASAAQRNKPADQLLSVVALLGVSIPNFWFGLVLILIFAVSLGWLPPAGFVSVRTDIVESLRYLVLPALTLGLSQAALISRMTRSTMLDVFNEDYVRTAVAKGSPPITVVFAHVFRNALIPVLTVIGLVLAALLSGAVVIETVFAIPGLGRLVINSIARRDYPVVQGVVLIVTAAYVFINLVIDLLYVAVDPRVKY